MNKLHPIIKDGQDQRIDGNEWYGSVCLCLTVVAVGVFLLAIGVMAPAFRSVAPWVGVVGMSAAAVYCGVKS